MLLSELKIGERARVVALNVNGKLAVKMQSMGITSGAEVSAVRLAPFSDPIEISVRGVNLCVRVLDASKIEVVKI